MELLKDQKLYIVKVLRSQYHRGLFIGIVMDENKKTLHITNYRPTKRKAMKAANSWISNYE